MGEYAYYVTPNSERNNTEFIEINSKEPRWIVTTNKGYKNVRVFCSWSSNIINLSEPFLTGHGQIICINTGWYD